jgi:hypothetical protein
MTSETRSSSEIEREIEHERAELADALATLRDRFSIDTIVRQIGDQFRQHGGELGRSVSRSAKDNPVALALTGIGLAWMILGRKSSSDRLPSTGWDTGYENPPERWPADDIPRATVHTAEPSLATTWMRAASPAPARDPAADMANAGRAKSGSMAESLGRKISDAGSEVADRLASARDSAGETVARIAEGTEALSEEARARVVAARRRAIEARNEARQSIRQGSAAAVDFYEHHPLVAGALALAVGAALAGSLPRTRKEDELMGAQSDQLFQEAERIFHEEREKAEAVMRSAAEEMKSIAEETRSNLDRRAPEGRTATEAAVEGARNAAERVAEKARQTAEKERLGEPTA